MPKKKAKAKAAKPQPAPRAAIPVSPPPVSWRAVPDNLGEGRVVLHDARLGLPELLVKPKKTDRWVVVHFPSRRHVVVASKEKGLAVLKEIHKGTDTLKLLPELEVKAKRKKPVSAESEGRAGAGARASKPKAPEVKADAKGAAGSPPEPLPNEPEDEERRPAPPEVTPVPAAFTFDQAMDHVFPNQRITAKWEMLLNATTPIYSKEGDYLGEAPAHNVQVQAAKEIMAYMKGRPSEKPPPPPEKKRVSYEELEKMITESPSARMVLRGIIEKAEAEAAAAEAENKTEEAAK